MELCSTCKTAERQPGQSYCRLCHNAYMRAWRATHSMTPEQRFKDTARSYANVYKRRGKLVPEACGVCGGPEPTEMHHDDYAKPLEVRWLCRPCHMAIHEDCV